MPRLAASYLIESVLAVRQALSAPICEKPTTSFRLPPAFCGLPVSDSFLLHDVTAEHAITSKPAKTLMANPRLELVSGIFISELDLLKVLY